ncbi:MAG TPA: T9SS type A sorting domain-containing protein [Bacteroidia bacterium]|nr:T9SS type A sorting domain-containing protein [Bacteroidia bacterium]
MKNRLLFIALLFFVCRGINAQSLQPKVIACSGNFATSATCSMTWTLGEVMTDTYSSASNFLTQGFNQPDTDFVTALISVNLEENITVYPNPAINYITVNLHDAPGNHIIHLYNVLGQLIIEENIPAGQQEFRIFIGDFVNGLYLINIINPESSSSSSFKISKTQ